ncbi:hypothetical protein WICMUC_001043 [Wickerhamomyces mucosus]|uniref:Dolichyl-diphosphooligosaccharide--protein glycosyltransferase subunit 1 n=1 Tax=Wickerhamomyces mucosus TaxID=1378264 RepID=A0A9P8PXG2_9ASCO|nr:hypothetical protein WICMUC_001043 [Wickerhamomyces mucosus]
MNFLSTIPLFLFLVTIVSSSFIPQQSWENVEILRTIDLGKSYVKEIIELKIKNLDSIPNNEYYFAIPNYIVDKLSTVEVIDKNHQQVLVESFDDVTIINSEPLVNYLKFSLNQPIAPKQSTSLSIELNILDILEPFPAKIDQSDEQILLLKTSKAPLSAYHTTKSTIKIIRVPNGQELKKDYEDEIEVKGKIVDKSIRYDYENVEPFTITALAFAYSHNAPLVKITSLNRGVWVSHWANTLQFEEFYKLTNKAAELIKGFSRADFILKRRTQRTSHAAAAFQLQLTEDAQDIYYTDLVGNVTTSRIVDNGLIIRPRFPIYGGWNYNFTVGWTNLLGDFVRDIGNSEYLLSVPIISGPVDSSYDEVSLNVYLPEGSKIVEVESEIPYVELIQDYELSYLDLGKGHTKLSILFKGLTDESEKSNVLIKYELSLWSSIKKSLEISKLLFIVLISYLVISKIDISLKAK